MGRGGGGVVGVVNRLEVCKPQSWGDGSVPLFGTGKDIADTFNHPCN